MNNQVRVVTPEEAELLRKQFPPEIEKWAAAQVAQEADLEKTASACVNYGAELAMSKIAQMEGEAAKSPEQKEDEKKKEEAKKTDEEKAEEARAETMNKEAQAMGAFILRGYLDTMLEKSAEIYNGDKTVYIDELCKEAGINEMVQSFGNFTKQASARTANPPQQFGNLRR